MFSSKSPNVIITELDLARDWSELDRLMDQEEWPFVHADIAVSHAQPRSVGLAARSGEKLLGFFAAHHFGDVGYLDMMIVDEAARVSTIARQLYFATINQMKQHGLKSFVVHSTNDSYRMFQFLRFKRGQSFTLLARDPVSEVDTKTASNDPTIRQLDENHLLAIINLDATVFGIKRDHWFNALHSNSAAKFHGKFAKDNDEIIASVAIRERKNNAVCLDAANARDFAALQDVVNVVLRARAHQRIECFARTDSPLHQHLLSQGFSVPEFFVPIGPLVEWRKGDTKGVGDSEHIQCLSWF